MFHVSLYKALAVLLKDFLVDLLINECSTGAFGTQVADHSHDYLEENCIDTCQ